jgi:hypothetical protein
MANSDDMLNDAKFENELQEMKKKGELDEFTARNVYQLRKQCAACQNSTYSKKQSNLVIGVTAAVNAVLAVIFSRFGGGSNG